VCVCVCQRGGPGPIWAVASQQKYWGSRALFTLVTSNHETTEIIRLIVTKKFHDRQLQARF